MEVFNLVELLKYTLDSEEETITRIVSFFGFHASLVNEKVEISENDYNEAGEILKEWQSDDSVLYVIYYDKISVGFLRISYRGPIVAWIEDIYIDKVYRGKGIATKAINIAEDIVRSNPDYVAICFDVAPRNNGAIDLYHKLGYNDISMITLRKEFKQSKRDKTVDLFGKKFNY